MSSFFEHKPAISEGDLTLVWLTRDNIKPLKPKQAEKAEDEHAQYTLHTRFGSFPYKTMIGKPFGTQLASTSSTKAGFCHLLQPTPELWSLSLPHRTQIVYTPDASYLVQRLRIRPGTKVIEAGTGSGSFTHALARTVRTQEAARSGRVWTFEFHEPRYEAARQEFEDHGLQDVVASFHRDVCKDGFDVLAEGTLDASAVFLDMPSPWQAIPHLKRQLSQTKITRICCFLPCMEQVQQAIETLRAEGWQDIQMVEIAARKWEARKEMLRRPEDAVERLRDIKERRETGLRRRNERKAAEAAAEAGATETEGDESGPPAPKRKAEDDGRRTELDHLWGKGKRVHEGQEGYEWRDVSKVEQEIKSHTSYLTFAYLPPPMPAALRQRMAANAREQAAPEEEQ
ncbi:tRNA methyltransferase complex GCD14 subunit-domain-containing protein [Dipodascopsis tothii]|uniref:tRNA methyltransferase complex GCD14 subunit-domain-containing protein n=1 Tax=Dipodascopsis tothii TaxID=44089 RepID=UPI0034CEB8BE